MIPQLAIARIARCLLAILASVAACLAAAQPYPSKPVRFINGSAPGSVIDVVTRQVADKLAAALQQPVIVENHPSAGGIAALDIVSRRPPDGYTLSMVHSVQMSVGPSLFPNLSYDPVKDFSHIGILSRGPQVLVVRPSLPVRSMQELITAAQANPGQVRYSSPGNGSPTHVYMEQLKAATGMDIQHIPYKGPAATMAVMSGEVDVLLEGLAPLLPQIRAGKLRPLAITGTRRLAVLPDTPTLAELGWHDFDAVWIGVVAPRGLPAPIVSRLN
ncbi:Bug family tripartite tricarboxylate transporter substrate binding protein [Cupriavidus sp. TMH.W2]|uniref:Bug family tripartite tricarboxylate transporter substrate binding protein n=1 Tax=Cupriavidus sp. TMH.W2 TaxID=3434465 RepID=UPI003D786D2E